MGIVKEVIKNQVKNQNLQYVYSSTGTIVKYDKTYNTADIIYNNPVGDGSYYQIGVPISNSLGGLTTNGIRSGQTCIITFTNGNINSPMITGVANSTYNQKVCKDQGAYIADEYIRETVEPFVPDIPMYQNWFDELNTWSDKYKAHEVDYTDVEPRKYVQDILADIDKFSSTEIGLTHLDTKATLKMKDNGDIDIFVTDNTGIRISREMHKIYLYGFDVNINGEMDLLAILRKCRDCEFDGYRDNTEKNKIKNDINEHIGYIEGDIEELKRCIAYTKEITGDIEYFSSLDSAIGKFETMKKNYNEGKYNDSIDDLQEVYGHIMTYYEYFEEELIAARERWGLA